MQRVYGSSRVSTDQQRDSGLSTDEQRVKIEARCLENSWQLQQVFVDAGVSGPVPLGERPEGGKLLAARARVTSCSAARMDRCFRSS